MNNPRDSPAGRGQKRTITIVRAYGNSHFPRLLCSLICRVNTKTGCHFLFGEAVGKQSGHTEFTKNLAPLFKHDTHTTMIPELSRCSIIVSNQNTHIGVFLIAPIM